MSLGTWLAMDRREAPSQDRVVALLSERPGLYRSEIQAGLGLSYARIVDLLARLERMGVVVATYESGAGTGCRGGFRYRLGGYVPPPPYRRCCVLSSFARALVQKQTE